MGVWGLIQIVFDIFLALGLGVCILRVSRRPQDDPRLSRALQLLQSKIAVLEDLSDRVDAQAARLSEMLQQKDHEVQDRIDSADGRIQSLRDAVDQGIETVRLAQSSLKAEDILEKKSSAKYAQAARLAYEGHSIDAISREVGLPRIEVEFITKVNRDAFRMSETVTHSPVAQPPVSGLSEAPDDFAQIFETPGDAAISPLSRLGEEFRRATQSIDIAEDAVVPAMQTAPLAPEPIPAPAPVVQPEPKHVMPQTFISAKAKSRTSHLVKTATAAPVIRKFEFPRIDRSR